MKIKKMPRNGRSDPEEQARTKEIKEQKKMLKDREFRPSYKQLEAEAGLLDTAISHVRMS